MTTLQRIPIEKLTLPVHDLWQNRWLLLCAGDWESGRFNAMTVAWGSLGTMWHKPFAQVVVRPTRHTFSFINEFPSFTLNAFPESLKPALQIMGSRSGRDGDKIHEAGLTPVASDSVEAPAFTEAELVLECRILYRQDMDPTCFSDPALEKNYPNKDYHRIVFGEIIAARGIGIYRSGAI